MITVSSIAAAVARADAAMGGLEQVLNDADARVGDGDTGGMLARVIHTMAQAELDAAADPGEALSRLARAAMSATGSSLGTLLATGLLAAGRAARGQERIDAGTLPDLVAAARDAMMARGGAALGDKTVLDSLDAIAEALKGAAAGRAAEAAAMAADEALETFRGRPNRIGRARMFGDQTVGIDDPGMLAVAALMREIAAKG